MSDMIVARKDPALSAQVVRAYNLVYADGASDADDRPPHVRAASGLTPFREHLAVIQDDANWLALIDDDDRVHALPLPARPESGARVFSGSRGNKHEKFDLEACIALPSATGAELIGFGSGSHPGREWILRIHESEAMRAVMTDTVTHARLGVDLTAEFIDATPFYDSLRAAVEFSGAGLNIEGAVLIDHDTIRLFQRGNAPEREGLQRVDATADLSWRALAAHLAAPESVPPPSLRNIRRYCLGEFEGVRLTFSDAEHLGAGRILYSASAEDPETGAVTGSALGIIEPDGTAAWGEIADSGGGHFEGKIEGLSLHPYREGLARFVIDDDDESVPSKIFEARLGGAFLRRPA